MKRLIYILLFITIILSAEQRTNSSFYLSADSLEKNTEVPIGKIWKYHSGDNHEWADPNFNDSSWETTTSTMNSFEPSPKEFTGEGWFRLRLTIDSSLINKPLAFDIWLAGAAEVFLNGEKVFTFGKILEDSTVENATPTFPSIMKFDKTNNLIAVRYYNDLYDMMMEKNFSPGFQVRFGYPSDSINSRYENISLITGLRNVFITIIFSI